MIGNEENEYSVMKVMTTILVVIAHVTVFYSDFGGVFSMEYNLVLDGITKFIYSFHMPLFIFLSGAVYHQCIAAGKYKSYIKFVKKKFVRLMVPYFLWGIFYVTPVMLILNITKLSAQDYIIKGILCAMDSRHLWFLWTLFFIFCIVRALRPVMEHWGFQMLLFAICCMLNYCSFKVTNKFGINSILQYLIYFVMGYMVDDRKPYADKFMKGKICLSAVSFIFILLFLNVYSKRYIARVGVSCAGIVMCYGLIENIPMKIGKIGKNRFYQILKKDSLGIYLVHPMIGYILFYLFQNAAVNPFFFTLCVFLADMISSFVIIEILRWVNVKFILGE